MLTLRRTHADGRITFQEFDAVESLLNGVVDIFDLQVFVEADERLAARLRVERRLSCTQRECCAIHSRCFALARKSREAGGLDTCARAVLADFIFVEDAI